MEREGFLAPGDAEAARAAYADLLPAARTLTREVAKAMDFDREEFDDRVTGDVVETAHDALFASLLEVRVADREAFEDWRDGTDLEVTVVGAEAVDGVAWHAAEFAGQAVAATFADEREAAVATLRRQAFGRIYRDALEG